MKNILGVIFFLFLTSASFADINFNNLENKKVSYLDFFFIKVRKCSY